MSIEVIKQKVQEYQEALKDGSITEEQYKDLLTGLELGEQVKEDVTAVEEQEEIKKIIQAALLVAKVASKI